jgi:hypothetical protein
MLQSSACAHMCMHVCVIHYFILDHAAFVLKFCPHLYYSCRHTSSTLGTSDSRLPILADGITIQDMWVPLKDQVMLPISMPQKDLLTVPVCRPLRHPRYTGYIKACIRCCNGSCKSLLH